MFRPSICHQIEVFNSNDYISKYSPKFNIHNIENGDSVKEITKHNIIILCLFQMYEINWQHKINNLH